MRALFLVFVLGFSAASFADAPDQVVNTVIKQLMSDVRNPNSTERVQQLCQLVRADVDLPEISAELLGPNFSSLSRDSKGIASFNALMPSIVVTEFYSLVSSHANDPVNVSSALLPKGSRRVGVKVSVGGTEFVITLNRKNMKILDAEWQSLSLVSTKHDEYQRELQRFWDTDNFHSMPVSDLVNELSSANDLLRCH